VREIKFRYIYGIPDRAKTYFTKVFTLDEIEGGKQYEIISDSQILRHHQILFRDQYIGRGDKKGVDIFDNDILLVKNRYGIFYVPVTFYNGYFASDNMKAKQIKNPVDWDRPHDKVESNGFHISAYNQLFDGYSNIQSYQGGKTSYDIEVVGSVHQNPELLD
jgi:uncharacterized phage protein (TIGR01671 family)